MQAIPIFADDDTKTKIDFDNGATCVIRTESQIYYTEYSYDDIVVPVYMNLQGISGSNMYYSGYIYGSTSAFNFTDSNSNRYVISYFENANDNIRTTYFRTNQFYNIYLDNVVLSNNNTTLIGYLHLMGNEQNPTLTLNCNNALQNMNVTAHNLYSTGYEFGFVNSMVYALNNSANLDGMYDILDHIENASLPEILTTIQTNYTSLYNLINSVWLTDQSVLSVSQQTYNTVLSILNILNHIDDTLDNISWKNLDLSLYGLTTDFNNYVLDNTVVSNGYIVFGDYLLSEFRNINNNRIYKLSFNLDLINENKNNILGIDLIVGNNNDISPITEYYCLSSRNHTDVYFTFDDTNLVYSNPIKIGIKFDIGRLYNSTFNSTYIDSNDIEFWYLFNAIKTGKIEEILSNHYTSQVNQVDAIKDEVGTNLQNLADDIIVEKPSAIANIADDYIEQVDTSHNYQVFSWLTAPTFVLMMSIVAGLAVISYMLYGGQ